MAVDAVGTGTQWQSRKWLAVLVRSVSVGVPFVGAVIVTSMLSRQYYDGSWSFGVKSAWFLGTMAVATVVNGLLTRVTRRLSPLSLLCEMELAFPSEAPSRLKVAFRAGSTANATEVRRRFIADGLSTDPARASSQVLELLSAMHHHDQYAKGHSERTKAIVDLIAEQLELSKEDRNRLQWATMLHDIGKLAVPSEILAKRTKLSAADYEIVKRHPAEGAKRIESLRPWLGEWARAVEDHHEQWDGTGYPLGLAGKQISIAGRIVAVADAYEVMTSARSYSRMMSHQAARAEMARVAGKQFDPEIVRALLETGYKRTPRVAAGLLSSWVGRFVGGDGAVASVVRSIGNVAGGAPVAAASSGVPAAAVSMARTTGFSALTAAKVAAVTTTIAVSTLVPTTVHSTETVVWGTPSGPDFVVAADETPLVLDSVPDAFALTDAATGEAPGSLSFDAPAIVDPRTGNLVASPSTLAGIALVPSSLAPGPQVPKSISTSNTLPVAATAPPTTHPSDAATTSSTIDGSYVAPPVTAPTQSTVVVVRPTTTVPPTSRPITTIAATTTIPVITTTSTLATTTTRAATTLPPTTIVLVPTSAPQAPPVSSLSGTSTTAATTLPTSTTRSAGPIVGG